MPRDVCVSGPRCDVAGILKVRALIQKGQDAEDPGQLSGNLPPCFAAPPSDRLRSGPWSHGLGSSDGRGDGLGLSRLPRASQLGWQDALRFSANAPPREQGSHWTGCQGTASSGFREDTRGSRALRGIGRSGRKRESVRCAQVGKPSPREFPETVAISVAADVEIHLQLPEVRSNNRTACSGKTREGPSCLLPPSSA